MPLPTLAKTWQYNVNQRLFTQVDANTTQKAVLLHIKNTLIGFASNPWTVAGSSNGVTAGMDGTDRWAALADVKLAAPPTTHSWIVLRQAAINSKFEVVFVTAATAGSSLQVVMSPTAGFGVANGGTDGSTNARPTATDEFAVFGTTSAVGVGAYDGTSTATQQEFICNIWQSTDGQVTRIVNRANTQLTAQFRMYAAFERPKNPLSEWTNPCMAAWVGNASGAMRYATHNDAALYLGNRPSGGSMAMFATTEGAGSSMVGEHLVLPNDLSGGYPMTPAGLLCTAAGARGRHGEVFDLWYGSTVMQNGDTYPDDGSKQFIQIGDLILPWNGSNPIMT
jgi:hypothetical protein